MKPMFWVLLLIPLIGETSEKTVFVAGGSGRTGAATVLELQRAGYHVVASTRDASAAKRTYPEIDRWVEVDAHDVPKLNAAVAGADVVVSTLGHGDFVGVGAPQFVGYLAVRNLVDAAKANKVAHFILISSSTAGHAHGVDHSKAPRFGYVLYWKTKAEDYLAASDLPFTILGPGGLVDDRLYQLRMLERPPAAGWGVQILARPDYERAFIDREGVAKVVRAAIETDAAIGKSVAIVWDKRVPAGTISGDFGGVSGEH